MGNNNYQRIIPLLIVFLLLNSIPIDIYLPAVKSIAIDLSTSVVSLQLGIYLYMISKGVGQLLLGPLSDKYGRRPIALFSLTIYTIASFIAVVSINLEMLMASRFFQGFGACGCAITALAIVRDNYNKSECARIYSILSGVQSLVPAIIPLIGSLIVINFGWRYCFLFLMLISIITIIFSINIIPRVNISISKVVTNQSMLSIIINRKFLPYALASVSATAFIVQYAVNSPVILIDIMRLTPVEFSQVFGFNALLIIFFSYWATRVIRKYSPEVACNIGLVFLALMSVLFFFNPTPNNLTTYIVVTSLGSAGFSFCLGSSTGLALSPFSKCAGKASAVIGFLQCVLSSFAGFVFGLFFSEGAQSMSITVFLFAFLSVMTSLLFRKWTNKRIQISST